MSKLIVYGDIHGCYDELIGLRKKINPQDNDIEVCVGDLITKGDDSLKTLHYVQMHNIQSVLGNHEDIIIRYLTYETVKNENPIILDKDESDIVNNLNSTDIAFLKNMPLYLKYRNITILHGGLHNNYNLDDLSKNEKSKIIRMRYLDKNHNFVIYGKENKDSIFWADVYNGSQGTVIYGHQWFQEVKKNQYAYGIDTGCVYGNKLSAIVFELENSLYINETIYSFNKLQ